MGNKKEIVQIGYHVANPMLINGYLEAGRQCIDPAQHCEKCNSYAIEQFINEADEKIYLCDKCIAEYRITQNRNDKLNILKGE